MEAVAKLRENTIYGFCFVYICHILYKIFVLQQPFFVLFCCAGLLCLLYKKCIDMRERVCYFKSVNDMSILDISREYMSRNDGGGGKILEEGIQKKYIPMTETTYYTLLSIIVPRHGYAIMQYVSELTKGRIVLGTGTLYTMVGRLVADGVIVQIPQEGKKAYQITDIGVELLRIETERLGKQLVDGVSVMRAGGITDESEQVL